MMNGSKLLEGYVPDIDATVVTRILDAGMVSKWISDIMCMWTHCKSKGNGRSGMTVTCLIQRCYISILFFMSHIKQKWHHQSLCAFPQNSCNIQHSILSYKLQTRTFIINFFHNSYTGGQIVGKAVCEPLCFGLCGDLPDTGPVLNPHDTSRLPGGSSAGSAVLVCSHL